MARAVYRRGEVFAQDTLRADRLASEAARRNLPDFNDPVSVAVPLSASWSGSPSACPEIVVRHRRSFSPHQFLQVDQKGSGTLYATRQPDGTYAYLKTQDLPIAGQSVRVVFW